MWWNYLTWPPVIVWAVLIVVALCTRRLGSGCFLTIISVLLALFLMFMVMVPSCVSAGTIKCPTSAERSTMFFGIGLATLFANAVMWFAIVKAGRSTTHDP